MFTDGLTNNWVTDFESSNIKRFGWNDHTLYVEFLNLSDEYIYAYPNVEETVFHAFCLSSSKGKYFATVIKPCYPVFNKIQVMDAEEFDY